MSSWKLESLVSFPTCYLLLHLHSLGRYFAIIVIWWNSGNSHISLDKYIKTKLFDLQNIWEDTTVPSCCLSKQKLIEIVSFCETWLALTLLHDHVHYVIYHYSCNISILTIAVCCAETNSFLWNRIYHTKFDILIPYKMMYRSELQVLGFELQNSRLCIYHENVFIES